ncbi:hypothetical protein J5N97_002812 [Dioscorea zingiberensis]|uniref:Protein SDA1 n=1 Tax=Dioscorea zingiberensis TaxID=325984 RepID=A0A9D5D302_9LILI|nr:hypothetical protein J5N97_002812 [Dioscorea zingiberensis]
MDVKLTDEQLAERRRKWTPPAYIASRGVLYKYIKNVKSASSDGAGVTSVPCTGVRVVGKIRPFLDKDSSCSVNPSQEDEARAKRALVVLSDLHRRRVWFDDRTANAICTSSFHSSSRIMISALSFLLGYDQVEEEDDSDDSDGEDDTTNQNAQILLLSEDSRHITRVQLPARKKRRQIKLQRVARSMKKQQRISSENNSNWYSPLAHLQDAQGFAEKLFSRLQKCNERFEAQQRDVTNLLAAAVHACHDLVPPDAVEPLFRQIVDQFVHDRSHTEAIVVGLNVVREICLRMPLLMNEDLLQDLVLYKKSHEQAVSTAARSLVVLFQEICPSLLVKKDQGRPTNPKAKPKAFGEVNVETNVPSLELFQNDGNSMSESSDDELNTSNDEDGLPQSTLDSGDNIEALCESKENNGNVEDVKEGEAAVSDEDDDEDTDKLMDHTEILSNEDFQRIKELKAKNEVKLALSQQGLLRRGSDSKSAAFKLPSSEQLSLKRVDPTKLEIYVKIKLSKEERLALVKAGREDRVKYQARIATKQNKQSSEGTQESNASCCQKSEGCSFSPREKEAAK